MLKNIILTLLLISGVAIAQNQPAPAAGVQASVNENGTGAVTLTAKGILPKPPLFFKANAQAKVKLSTKSITQEIALTLDVLQGSPELITLSLHGAGDVTAVSGTGLADWAVRTSADGKNRYLDLKPVLTKGKPNPKLLKLTVRCQFDLKSIPATTQLLTLGPGKASGFTYIVNIDTGGIDALHR